MLEYVGKIIIMFVVALGAMRLMGSATMAQLTPYDLVTIIIVGTLVAEPLVTADVGRTVIGLVLVILLNKGFSRLSLYDTARRFFLGEPILLVNGGKIVKKNLRRTHTSLAELISILRSGGCADPATAQYVILEPTGRVSIVPRNSSRMSHLPMPVILDGEVQKETLARFGRDEEWLRRELEKKGLGEPRDVFFAAIDSQGNLHLDQGEGT